MHFYVYSYASKLWIVESILHLSQKEIFQYVNPFTLKHYVGIKTWTFSIYNANKQATTKYDTHPNRKPTVIFIGNAVEKEDVSVPIHQL